jgi:hypothetical protein
VFISDPELELIPVAMDSLNEWQIRRPTTPQLESQQLGQVLHESL